MAGGANLVGFVLVPVAAFDDGPKLVQRVEREIVRPFDERVRQLVCDVTDEADCATR